jgi:hypothetical protein
VRGGFPARVGAAHQHPLGGIVPMVVVGSWRVSCLRTSPFSRTASTCAVGGDRSDDLVGLGMATLACRCGHRSIELPVIDSRVAVPRP